MFGGHAPPPLATTDAYLGTNYTKPYYLHVVTIYYVDRAIEISQCTWYAAVTIIARSSHCRLLLVVVYN